MDAAPSQPLCGKTPVAFAFATLCGAWVIASVVIPATAAWEDVFFFALILSASVSGGLWLAVAAWAAIPIAALIVAIRFGWKKQYGSAIRWFSLPAAGVFLYFFATDIGDAARFRWNKSSYDQIIADARAGKCATGGRVSPTVQIDGIDCDGPIVVIFLWGGFLSSWHGVVYDATDEIGKPPRDRSATWRYRRVGRMLSCSGARRAFGDHYYRAGGHYTPDPDDCIK